MKATRQDYLFRVEAPWIYVGEGEAERKSWIPSYFYARSGMNVCVRRLRGWKMRTEQSLMDEFAAALQFFEGFGENWNALEECLDYMDEWLPADAYILLIERAENLLVDDDEGMAILLRVLQRVGEWWSRPIEDNDRFNRPPRPFHCLFLGPEFEGMKRILDVAARQKVPVRTDRP